MSIFLGLVAATLAVVMPFWIYATVQDTKRVELIEQAQRDELRQFAHELVRQLNAIPARLDALEKRGGE